MNVSRETNYFFNVSYQDNYSDPVSSILKTEAVRIKSDWTIDIALQYIRENNLPEGALYFYVIDNKERLVGVLPVRTMLLSALNKQVSEVMQKRVMTISSSSTILDACEYFALYRFLSFPVVDEEGRFLGVIDAQFFANEVVSISEKEQVNELFESIGVRVELINSASTWKAFGLRFPWLVITVLSGSMCALLTGVFEDTLQRAVVLAFFMTLALGLGESVSIQSMGTTIHQLRTQNPSLRTFLKGMWKELPTAMLLGACCGSLVSLIVAAWQGFHIAALSIGVSIFLSISFASLAGQMVPTLLHLLKLDLKISAGPVSLAIADLGTIFFYYGTATLLIG